jgi:hypothetical protein
MTAIIARRLLDKENRRGLGRIWLDRRVERQFENASVAVEQVALEIDLHAGVARLPDKIIDPGERRRIGPQELPAKNALITEDADLVGAAFRGKLASLEASTGMEPTVEPIDRFEAATGAVALTAEARVGGRVSTLFSRDPTKRTGCGTTLKPAQRRQPSSGVGMERPRRHLRLTLNDGQIGTYRRGRHGSCDFVLANRA